MQKEQTNSRQRQIFANDGSGILMLMTDYKRNAGIRTFQLKYRNRRPT